jgi:hypothetical protein
MSKLIDGHQLAYDWFVLSEKSNLILSFKGDFNQDLITVLLSITEKKSNSADNTDMATTRLLTVIMECLQNICKHALPTENGFKPGLILVSQTDDLYTVRVGNLMSNSEVESLTKELKDLQKLSKDELKSRHKEVLSKTELSSKSGAGLGLIGVFRKTDKVDFDFKKIDDLSSFFNLTAEISVNSLEKK